MTAVDGLWSQEVTFTVDEKKSHPATATEGAIDVIQLDTPCHNAQARPFLPSSKPKAARAFTSEYPVHPVLASFLCCCLTYMQGLLSQEDGR